MLLLSERLSQIPPIQIGVPCVPITTVLLLVVVVVGVHLDFSARIVHLIDQYSEIDQMGSLTFYCIGSNH